MDTVQDRRRLDVRDRHRCNMLSDDCAVVENRSFELAVVAAVDRRSVEIEANQMDSAVDDDIEKSVVVAAAAAKMKMRVAMNDEMRK